MDVLRPLARLLEKLFGNRGRRRVADARISDRAKLLRRQLAATFDDWPLGARTLEELTGWAHQIARGFSSTEMALGELVELRAEASPQVRRAVEAARDAYYAAAELLTPVVNTGERAITHGGRQPAQIEAVLRKAFEHVRQCLAALDKVVLTTKD